MNVEEFNVAQTLLPSFSCSRRRPRRHSCLRHVYLLMLFMAPSVAANPVLFKDPQYKVRVTSDIVYGKGALRGGSKDLLLDLYEPEGAPARRPGCVAIHGGAFRAGDKVDVASVCQELAARGYVCASINHRMEGDDPDARGETLRDRTLNAAIDDAATATRWLKRNAARLKMDRKRIALLGRSSGAGIVMRVAYSKVGRKLGVRAVLDMSGAMKGHVDSIRKGDAPLCIIHGTNDTLVPVAAATELAERARKVGLPHEIHLLEGRNNGHITYFTREIDGVTLLQKTVDFFYRHLDLANH